MSTTTPTSKGSKAAAPKKATLSMWGMAILTVTTVLSLRGLPSQAEFGYTSIFWYILAAILFLVPFSLVCAELASTYTHSGGLFRWCAEAFGPRWGWAAMYMEWIMVLIWFPAVLMFAAVALAYIFWPETFDARLANNKIYTICIVLGVFWAATFNTFRGIKSSNTLSKLGGIFGTIIPGAILIILLVLAVIYYVVKPSTVSKVLIGVILGLMVISLILGMHIGFRNVTVLDVILMVVPLAIGVGLVLKNLIIKK